MAETQVNLNGMLYPSDDGKNWSGWVENASGAWVSPMFAATTRADLLKQLKDHAAKIRKTAPKYSPEKVVL